ncbi:hypothetical protein BSLG_000026 [Batrachochytrium salamandrivorans]|nr:hypothetical protein BSLG_000026 [Batrachochytrium salamandrivorans]
MALLTSLLIRPFNAAISKSATAAIALSLLQARHMHLSSSRCYSSLFRPLSLWRTSPISSTIKSFAVTASPLSTNPYTTHTPATTSNRQQGIQSLLREYGPLALGVYLTLSFTIFCCCLASISFLGIDESHIAAAFAYLKGWVGYTQEADAAQTEVASPAADKDQAISTAISWLPEWAQSPAAIRIGSNILLAMAMTKLFMPLKIAITAAIVPAVSKRARSMGFTFGQKGGIGSAVRDVKSQMRS